MTVALHRLCFVALCGLTQVCPSAAEESAPNSAIVFRDVNVLPMDYDGILPRQAVLIESGRIVSIVPADGYRPPRGARVIEAKGAFLLPGLVDFHRHPQAPQELVSDAAYGVTTVVALDGEGVEWRRHGLKPPDFGAHLIGSTHILEGIELADNAYAIDRPADAHEIVEHQRKFGADLVKTYVQITLPEFRALVHEAHTQGMPVVGHTPAGLPIDEVLGGGLDLIAHSEEFKRYLDWRSNDADYAAVVSRVAKHDIGVIASLSAVKAIEGQALRLDNILADAEIAYLSSSAYQGWLARNNDYAHRPEMTKYIAGVRTLYGVQRRVVRELNDAGVLLLLGTDAPVNCLPGTCVHEELELLIEAGLSNYDALRSATFNAGLFVSTRIRARAADRFGTVAPGARADLVLVEANPLEAIHTLARPLGVMIAGEWRTRSELDSARARLAKDNRRRQDLVDTYESLLGASDLDGLFEFLDSSGERGGPLLSERIVCNDALALAKKGDPRQGAILLQKAAHLLPDSFLVQNTLGKLLLMSGDRSAARAAYQRSLEAAPNNAAGKAGLRATHP